MKNVEFAEYITNACIKAAREGFTSASIQGLCQDGAMEAAISAMQSLNLKDLVNQYDFPFKTH